MQTTDYEVGLGLHNSSRPACMHFQNVHSMQFKNEVAIICFIEDLVYVYHKHELVELEQ